MQTRRLSNRETKSEVRRFAPEFQRRGRSRGDKIRNEENGRRKFDLAEAHVVACRQRKLAAHTTPIIPLWQYLWDTPLSGWSRKAYYDGFLFPVSTPQTLSAAHCTDLFKSRVEFPHPLPIQNCNRSYLATKYTYDSEAVQTVIGDVQKKGANRHERPQWHDRPRTYRRRSCQPECLVWTWSSCFRLPQYISLFIFYR
jgi:hypothetical protein